MPRTWLPNPHRCHRCLPCVLMATQHEVGTLKPCSYISPNLSVNSHARLQCDQFSGGFFYSFSTEHDVRLRVSLHAALSIRLHFVFCVLLLYRKSEPDARLPRTKQRVLVSRQHHAVIQFPVFTRHVTTSLVWSADLWRRSILRFVCSARRHLSG